MNRALGVLWSHRISMLSFVQINPGPVVGFEGLMTGEVKRNSGQFVAGRQISLKTAPRWFHRSDNGSAGHLSHTLSATAGYESDSDRKRGTGTMKLRR